MFGSWHFDRNMLSWLFVVVLILLGCNRTEGRSTDNLTAQDSSKTIPQVIPDSALFGEQNPDTSQIPALKKTKPQPEPAAEEPKPAEKAGVGGSTTWYRGKFDYRLTNEDSSLVITFYKEVAAPREFHIPKVKAAAGNIFGVSEPTFHIEGNRRHNNTITGFYSTRKIEVWKNNKQKKHRFLFKLTKGSEEFHYRVGRKLTKGNIIVQPYRLDQKLSLPNGDTRDAVLYVIWVNGGNADVYASKEASSRELSAWRYKFDQEYRESSKGAKWFHNNRQWYNAYALKW